jgi:site-specific DNA recombinase
VLIGPGPASSGCAAVAEKRFRCAVYTRKSTEDGLEQEFNSLDAQYEACAAYALSRRHEGWVLLPARYDDGGFSGGNMQRPGMQRLMTDVAGGKVDIILVYKIDRLTRSLADFAKIVEVLDKGEASFVSIAQSFNTTTSMGRLTLNMLLSFAQFEREVTGERIRDKIAVSKRKGLWMGGPVPLGYAVENRKLIVNNAEADVVRHIMQQRASGPHRDGCIFRRRALYRLLANHIYIGQLTHKGEHFPAEHPPIIDPELWGAVQAKLRGNASGTSRRLKAQQPSLLAGFISDGEDRAMTPSHATKPARRYRYYITRPDLLDGSPAWRVSAHDLEELVCDRLSQFPPISNPSASSPVMCVRISFSGRCTAPMLPPLNCAVVQPAIRHYCCPLSSKDWRCAKPRSSLSWTSLGCCERSNLPLRLRTFGMHSCSPCRSPKCVRDISCGW